MSKIKTVYNKIREFISNNDVEITMFFSAFFIILASFLLNIIFGFYIIGFILLAISIFLLKYPKK